MPCSMHGDIIFNTTKYSEIMGSMQVHLNLQNCSIAKLKLPHAYINTQVDGSSSTCIMQAINVASFDN